MSNRPITSHGIFLNKPGPTAILQLDATFVIGKNISSCANELSTLNKRKEPVTAFKKTLAHELQHIGTDWSF